MGSHLRHAAIILVLACLAPVVRSQCMYTTTFCYSFPMGGPYTMWVCFKNLTMDESCATMTVTSGGIVTTCYYIPGQDRLVGGRPPGGGGGAGYCQVACNCGTMRIDETDGLPVELMEFEIEDGSDPEESEPGAGPITGS